MRALIFTIALFFIIPGLVHGHTISPTGSLTVEVGQTITIDIAPAGPDDDCTVDSFVEFDTTTNDVLDDDERNGTVIGGKLTFLDTDTHPVYNISAFEEGKVSISIWFSGVGDECPEIQVETLEVTVVAAGSSGGNGSDGDPINTFTGELFNDYAPDIYLNSPMPLFFSRYYYSGLKADGVTGAMGDNWRHSFEMALTINGANATIRDNKGRNIQFTNDGFGYKLIFASSVEYQLVASGSGYIFFDPSQNREYFFNSNGSLETISDGKGNVHTLTYGNGNLVEISDGLGRSLTFTYDTKGKLSTVSDGSRKLEFAYTGDNLTGVINTMGNTTTYSYVTGGLKTSATRPMGNTPYTHVYDSSTRVISQTDADGNTNTLSYGTANTTTMTDPLGSIRKQIHSNGGNLIESTDKDGFSVKKEYDRNRRVTSITNRLGNKTTITYDKNSGKVASKTYPDGTTISWSYTVRTSNNINYYDLTGITYPDGSTESFAHDSSGNVTKYTDRNGEVWTYTYNKNGQRLTMVNPAGGVTSFSYNSDATLVSSNDYAGNLTFFSYDSLKRLTKISYADGASRGYTYDNNDNILTQTDEGGNVTTFTYDKNNNLTVKTDALGNTETFAYDSMDRTVSVTDALGFSSSLTYDKLERLKTNTDRIGNTNSYGYDVRNHITSLTDGANNLWLMTYNAEGVIASSSDPLSNTTSFTSDKMGRLENVTTPRGNTTKRSYDQMGRIIESTDPLGNVTKRSYDKKGLPAGITMAGGAVNASYVRDKLGMITTVTDPNGNKWERTYDTQSRLTATIDPLGSQTVFGYDSRNRLTKVSLPDNGTLELTRDATGNVTRRLYSDSTDITYAYDKLNRLTSVNGVSMGYDANGHIIESNGLTVKRDANGRIKALTLASGKSVAYEYDTRSLVTKITDWQGGETTFFYDNAGNLITVNRPNGINTTYSYDADGLVSTIQHGSLANIALTRDGNGHITSAIRNLPLEPLIDVGSTNLSYDGASQVASFTYDKLGRLTATDKINFSWDMASRLTGYTSGSTNVSFAYDGLGNLLSRSEAGTTRNYVWNYAFDLNNISVERESGSDLRYYIHTPDGHLLYSIGASDNNHQFYHFDEMGNTQFITDNAGTLAASYAYDPYGVSLGATGTLLDNPFTWQGLYGVMQEGTNGLYYMRARYYNGKTGRFISRDPVKRLDPRNINPYQYAMGNPLKYIDPSGLEEDGIFDGIRDWFYDAFESARKHLLPVPDPDDPDWTDDQERIENREENLDTAAKYVDAASAVVSAGAPAPGAAGVAEGASTLGTLAIGTQAGNEASEGGGVMTTIGNALSSAGEAIGGFISGLFGD